MTTHTVQNHSLVSSVKKVTAAKWTLAMVAGLLALLAIGTASAGTTGTEFEGLYDLLIGWAEGYLGKALAIAAFIGGIFAGVARSSPTLAAIGVVFAIVISVGPNIINGILTATI